MEARTAIKEAEESDAGKKTKTSTPESSIFSTILADIEHNPTILQKQKNLSAVFSIFSTIVADTDEENPTILQEKNKNLTKTRRGRSMKSPDDFNCTVSQTLTHSDLVDILNQELEILKSEMESKGQTSDQFVPRSPNYGRECDCVKEGRLEEEHEEVEFLADEVLEWISRGEGGLNSEDSVCKPEDVDTLENSDEMLAKIENDGSFLERIQDDYEYGDFIEDLSRKKLRDRAEKEENEISSWITNGEPEVETRVAEEKKEDKRDTKKKSPVKVKLERSEQESTVTKHDYFGYKRRLYLIEKLRERSENLMKRRVRAVRFGVEFSFLVAEYMFLIPNEFLGSEIEDYWIRLKRFGVNGDDKGTSVIIGKLEGVFEMVIRKREHHNVNLLESTFRFHDYINPLCVNATQILGKIVWALRSNQRERLKLSVLDSLFEDCQRVLMKMELKLAEIKQRDYRSVSADYESFSKSQRFDIVCSEERL